MSEEINAFNEAELIEAFEYLDELRASGRTNMWAAHGFLARDLLWPNDEANRATGLWMSTFNANASVGNRVAKAIEAQRADTPKSESVADESAVAKPFARKDTSA